MDLHYSQTIDSLTYSLILFHYLMDLHYSQTKTQCRPDRGTFHYLMDLHYSQTSQSGQLQTMLFHYLMDLHYSQTRGSALSPGAGFTTLWIYTILKLVDLFLANAHVSLPYGFTLFSNWQS